MKKLNEHSLEIDGVIKSVDLHECTFKIESSCRDKKMIIGCNFDKNFEEYLISNLNNRVSLRIKRIMGDFSNLSKNEYELLEIHVNH